MRRGEVPFESYAVVVLLCESREPTEIVCDIITPAMDTQRTIIAPDTDQPTPGADNPDPVTKAVSIFLSHLKQSDLPPVAKVLLYGSHARGDQHADSDIDIAVVLRGDAPPRSERSVLRRKLSYLNSDAILESLQPLSAVLLWESMLNEPDKALSSAFYHNVLADGVEINIEGDTMIIKPAKAYIPPTRYSDHSLHDARSLALHCKIAYKISQDPSLLDKARANLARWRAGHEPGRVPLALEEWERILTLDWKQVAALLIGLIEDAIRLRSSSPFTGILTEEERLRIFEAFSRD